MFPILLTISGTGLVLTATLLAIVVAGIRQEPAELSSEAPRAGAALVRRLLGVHVRRLDADERQTRAAKCIADLTSTEGR